jgi:hypothetical protein
VTRQPASRLGRRRGARRAASSGFDQINDAVSAMTSGDVIKPVVRFDGSSNVQEAY